MSDLLNSKSNWLVLSVFFATSIVHANVLYMPREVSDYKIFSSTGVVVENVEVENAQLAYVNYVALRRDFTSLNNLSNDEIDRLLLHNFSFVSEHQLPLSGVRNTQIAVGARTRKSLRPSGYGRADVIEFLGSDGRSIGLIDRKGVGVMKHKLDDNLFNAQRMTSDELQVRDHSDGLMTLGEAIAETTRQMARQRLYELAAEPGQPPVAETVETYFILALPFSILKGQGRSDQAAIYARQAHIGRNQFVSRSPLPLSEQGVLQSDYFGAAVDQGAIAICDSRLESTFGAFGSRKTLAHQENSSWVWAHDTANKFGETKDRQIVEQHIQEMLAPLPLATTAHVQQQRSKTHEGLRDFALRFIEENYNSANVHMAEVAGDIIRIYKGEGFQRSEQQQNYIMRLSDHESEYVRYKSMQAIEFLSPEQKQKLVDKLLNDPSVYVRRNLAHLNHIDKTTKLRVLSTLRYDSNDRVRKMALETISRLKLTDVCSMLLHSKSQP